ncbi:putative disease resistance protein RGA3 [Prunus avium]|uniref:Disease resistance protein RGA3 n=1 Tax=Prunus avium TaxID=42229 RepID=A0A6P5TY36_PRUAV|nr:putative disease resistance protein RGA3 [Prunus avium]
MLAKLTSLDYLRICNSCDSMRSFPLGIFPKLTVLDIDGCENLESLFLIEEEGAVENLSHLNHLRVYKCPKMVCFHEGELPTPNLSDFVVAECETLKSLPGRLHTLTALRSLSISSLPNLESFAEDGGLPPNLRLFHITNCERLRASSVGEYWGLQALVSLEHFLISGSDHVLETLLKEQLLPTTLHTLSIYSLSTLKSLDGKGLGHLTSLQALKIGFCPSLEFLPGEELQHLTSLQELRIMFCPSLQFLPGEELQHLTSLQTLSIFCCPSLQCLQEEGLPPSLTYLCIEGCPALKERYKNKTGQDGAKISHIPCIQIGNEVII